MRMKTKEEYKTLLHNNIVNLTFKKLDGSERTMKCTLSPALLPVVEKKESSKKKKENDNVLPVWNLDENAFRSFRIDSVIKYDLICV